jgi:hypothetical protein
MSDRLFTKAQSEGWTDLFINDGKVWGYRDAADVMPQQYPDQVSRDVSFTYQGQTLTLNTGHFRQSYGISCRAVLMVQGEVVHGTYHRPSTIQHDRHDDFGWMRATACREPDRFVAERIGLDAFRILRSLSLNLERFNARLTLIVEPQYQGCLEWTSKDVSCLATRLECNMALDLVCSAQMTLFNHTEGTLTAVAQPAPMQHQQP